jgi:hypothetical protein
MAEQAESFHSSFNEDFCIHLEFRLCSAFENSNDEELTRFWCDGVSSVPYYRDEDNLNYLSAANIGLNRKIETMAWLGITGQEPYELTIVLGENAWKRYCKGKSMIDCIPEAETTEWIDIDTENKTLVVRLK